MGREIRRVPPGWEHPRYYEGDYIPLFDRTYAEALKDWKEDGACEDDKPEKDWYRPAFDQEPTAYQMYETVTEGTPVSPVFETLPELIDWLVGQGHSRHAAEAFAESGWAPSLVMKNGHLFKGIDSFDLSD